jgi:hypothetical protein
MNAVAVGLRTFSLVLGLALGVGWTASALAAEHHDHGRPVAHRHHWHDGWGYAPPPVVYAPPVPGYYAPPVVTAPAPGLNIIVPLHIR